MLVVMMVMMMVVQSDQPDVSESSELQSCPASSE